LISILILTKNEKQDLPGCLESVHWSDDVHVYDSGSTDETAEIAAAAGARFVQRSASPSQELFGGNEAAHKNWALANIPFKYRWVLHLDADERVTPELATSIQRAVQTPGDKVAFRLRRRDFWGKLAQARDCILLLHTAVSSGKNALRAPGESGLYYGWAGRRA
jgi:glycosyltransferase involved in cell wall biosynthesis